jgi:hypothetical protein
MRSRFRTPSGKDLGPVSIRFGADRPHWRQNQIYESLRTKFCLPHLSTRAFFFWSSVEPFFCSEQTVHIHTIRAMRGSSPARQSGVSRRSFSSLREPRPWKLAPGPPVPISSSRFTSFSNGASAAARRGYAPTLVRHSGYTSLLTQGQFCRKPAVSRDLLVTSPYGIPESTVYFCTDLLLSARRETILCRRRHARNRLILSRNTVQG